MLSDVPVASIPPNDMILVAIVTKSQILFASKKIFSEFNVSVQQTIFDSTNRPNSTTQHDKILSFVIAVTILRLEYLRHQKGVSQTVVLDFLW